MSANTLYPVQSDPLVHFIAAVAQNVNSPIYNIQIPTPGIRRWSIKAITVIGMEAIAPEFNFWSSVNGINANVGLDRWLGSIAMLDTEARQFGGAGVFRWYKGGLDLGYYDFDTANSTAPPSLHVSVANRVALGKTAAPGGAISVTFWLKADTGAY